MQCFDVFSGTRCVELTIYNTRRYTRRTLHLHRIFLDPNPLVRDGRASGVRILDHNDYMGDTSWSHRHSSHDEVGLLRVMYISNNSSYSVYLLNYYLTPHSFSPTTVAHLTVILGIIMNDSTDGFDQGPTS